MTVPSAKKRVEEMWEEAREKMGLVIKCFCCCVFFHGGGCCIVDDDDDDDNDGDDHAKENRLDERVASQWP
jgi:hypothetical protein